MAHERAVRRNIIGERMSRNKDRDAMDMAGDLTIMNSDLKRSYASQGRQRSTNDSSNNGLHYSTRKIAQMHIDLTFEEIKSERIARLTGLVSHFVYWCVFGHINQMPLDEYHLKQLFISIA